MSVPDELYSLKNHFWLGNYQLGIHEGVKLRPSTDALKTERDAYVYRCYIAMGNPGIVIDERANETNLPTAINACKLLARYTAEPQGREIQLATLDEWMNDANTANNPVLQTIAATVYMAEANWKNALKSIRHGTNLEQIALTLQTYLAMNRVDLADKQLKLLQQVDDDSTLTQLCMAWVYMAMGGAKYQEAAYIFQELIDKYGDSVTLLNNLAVAHMHLRKFDQAQRCLLDAMGKNASDVNTLVNMIVCARHLKSSDEQVNRYISDVRRLAPQHPWLKKYEATTAAFEKALSAQNS